MPANYSSSNDTQLMHLQTLLDDIKPDPEEQAVMKVCRDALERLRSAVRIPNMDRRSITRVRPVAP